MFAETDLPPAILALADGSVFRGVAIGASGQTVGEVVFNTAMTGYQEILTDPSYRQQMVTLTYPHIGNVGTNAGDEESDSPQAAGLIVREVPRPPSSWRNTRSLPDYLHQHGIVAIADIDTRRLTRILREKGAQNGCILTGEQASEEAALAQARGFAGLKGLDLAADAGTQEQYSWSDGLWTGPDEEAPLPGEPALHVAVYDYGVKKNILRSLVSAGCRVTVVPPRMAVDDVLALGVDGVMLSNGPGDPDPCDYAIAAARELLARDVPTMGICLGHQILGLAVGARTLKMKFGHHGANHPVQDIETGAVMITSQNHGFAVDEATLPEGVIATHRSLFDHSLQGIRVEGKPAFSFQGHPEASPGPQDVAPMFKRFVQVMENAVSR